ncbi:MAG: hypothetical protein N2593_04015 [Patescibacteria group bacterium]|nr:hypothetical protein [Patescibacteria group bacterium]
MSLSVSESLAKFGFNPQEKVNSETDFKNQLESYILHVFEDKPVSNRYSYFLKNGKIFTEGNQEFFIDPEERGGYSLKGTLEAISLSLDNPGKLIFLYSPPGPVTFTAGTKYDKLAPYPSGQLYIMTSDEFSNRIDAIAISVSREVEDKVLGLLRLRHNSGFDDEKQKIIYYLTHPQLFYGNIDNLINDLGIFLSKNEDFLVYKNVRGERFNLSHIISFLISGWRKELKSEEPIDYDELYKKALTDPKLAYLGILYARSGGSSVPLGGSCGGSETNPSEIEEILHGFNLLSTSWRISDILKSQDSDKYGSLEFECPHCRKKVKRPKNTLIEKCPHCEGNVRC